MTFKKIIIGVVVLLLSIANLWAQNCVRQISTQYNSAYNNELVQYYPTQVNPWLNTTNFAEYIGPVFSPINLNPNAGWIIPGYTGGTLAMVSPFSPSMGGGYEYLWGPTGNAPSQQDIHWNDGWEMMWLNTGYYPNGERIDLTNNNRITQVGQPLANPRTPYMVLYNRYTGKLRFFANIYSDLNAFDSARLTMMYNPLYNVSGILRHVHNYDQALDEPTKATEFSSANVLNTNNNNLWWSTDFQLGYDPCVCKHSSSFDFKIRAASTLDVDLFGRSVGMVQNIGAYGSSFLSNETIRDAAHAGEGGSLLFKSIGGMLDEYKNQMDLYNTRLKSYNAPMNQGLRLILDAAKTGIASAGGSFVNNVVGDLGLRTLTMINGPADANTTTSKKWAEQASNAAKGALAKEFDNVLLPNLGIDFLDAPMKPSMPTATFSEMRIAGSITDNSVVSITNFLTPGSYKFGQTLTPFNYPAYNNAVGLFALLRKPKALMQYNATKRRDVINIIPGSPHLVQAGPPEIIERQLKFEQLFSQNHQVALRLQDPLKYKFNKALDFDDAKTKLYVSFVVEMDNAIFDPDTTCFNVHVTNFSNNFYLRDAFPPQDNKPYQIVFESVWKDMETVGETMFDVNFANRFNTHSFVPETQITYPNSVFPEVTLGVIRDCINEDDAVFNVKRIKMKVAADMYFNQIGSNGLQNNTFQSFTYLLFDRETGVDILSTTQDSSLLRHYKQANLVLTNEVIETTDPFVMETRGNVIYVNAETIELNGNIGVQAGYTAVLQTTKSIKAISGNTNLSNKIRLRNVNGFSRFDNITETSQSEVDAFCNDQNNGYKALVAANKTDDTQTEQTDEEPVAKIKTMVYPNPATNVFYVSISAEDEKEYAFTVYDLTGRTLINETIKGANQPQFEITTDNLVSGTYLLKITTDDGTVSETHRIVILK